MDKKDIAYGIAALIIVIVIALVMKPITPSQTDNALENATPTIPANNVVPGTVQTLIPDTTVIQTPVPTPTWDKRVQNISFIDPSTYGVSFNSSAPQRTRFDTTTSNTSLVTFATISGKTDGTSQVIDIPFPYWELWYTVEPAGSTGGSDQSMSTSTVTGPKRSGIKGSGSSITNIEGSYSVVIPVFTIQVMDGKDPNRIVRTISPPGGIDENLWKGMTVTGEDSDTTEIPDPRPWKERFFEGERDYFFIIHAESLDSYSIEVKVPQRYIDSNASILK